MREWERERKCVWQVGRSTHVGTRAMKRKKSPSVSQQDRVNSQAEVAHEQKHMAAPGIIKILFPVPQSPAETEVSSRRKSGFCQTANL